MTGRLIRLFAPISRLRPTGYALVDGAICGLLFGWLYHGFAAGWSREGAL